MDISDEQLEKIEQLFELFRCGFITESELERSKAAILRGESAEVGDQSLPTSNLRKRTRAISPSKLNIIRRSLPPVEFTEIAPQEPVKLKTTYILPRT